MAFTLNGCGTKFYGERDYMPDGTFVTTEWITILYLPIVPLRSYRIKPLRSSGFTVLVASWSSGKFSIYEKTLPNWKQVLSVYGFFVGLFSLVALVIAASERFGDHYDFLRLLVMPAIVIPFFFPYLLRRQAQRRLIKRLLILKEERKAQQAEAPVQEPIPRFIPTPRKRY